MQSLGGLAVSWFSACSRMRSRGGLQEDPSIDASRDRNASQESRSTSRARGPSPISCQFLCGSDRPIEPFVEGAAREDFPATRQATPKGGSPRVREAFLPSNP